MYRRRDGLSFNSTPSSVDTYPIWNAQGLRSNIFHSTTDLVRLSVEWDNILKVYQRKESFCMNDDIKQPEDCKETSCKDDLFQGLMALFAQADAAEENDAPSSDKD